MPGLLLCCSAGLAQDSPPHSAIEEVRVVGSPASRTLGTSSHRNLEFIDPQGAAGSPPNIAQILQQYPGIGFSGQGGLFQTVSIRGLSRHRVANFYLDIPILTERRAGTSSQFIDPLMLGEIELLRGPASTYYGSGAMGGVLQFKPRRLNALEAELGWSSGDDGNVHYLAGSREGIALAISHRRASGNSESSDGTPLHTEFEQMNSQLALQSEVAGLSLKFDTLFSYGSDIGKSNIRYPEQAVSDYPSSRHWLGQLSIDSASVFHSSIFFHAQDLVTQVETSTGDTTRGDSQALDLGASTLVHWDAGALRSRLGLDYLARRNVRSDEVRGSAQSLDTLDQGDPDPGDPDPGDLYQDNLDAEQDQVGLFADLSTETGPVSLSGGLRASYVSQQDARSDRDEDSAVSAFARGDWQLTSTTVATLEIASGVRFPTLSERYFNGTTGRGIIQGNPDLEPELSLSLEAGLSSQWKGIEWDIRGYSMTIDDFITRVEPAPDEFSYINGEDGNIKGVEFSSFYALTDKLSLFGRGQYIEGEDSSGEALQDIAPNSVGAGFRYTADRAEFSLDYQHRFAKSRVPDGERPVDSAHLLSANFSLAVGADFTLSVWAHNLLNDSYWISTDRLSTRGEERSVGINLAWRR
jgi:iron complex outermembrane receptor protein